jgi:biotin carboxyl carrier protein
MKNLRITIEGKTYDVQVEIQGDDSSQVVQPLIGRPVQAASVASAAAPAARPAPKPSGPAGPGEVVSPLSAVVVGIDVQDGQVVQEGDKLFTLEAMKMNTIITAPKAGTVRSVTIQTGDAVEEGQVIAIIE